MDLRDFSSCRKYHSPYTVALWKILPSCYFIVTDMLSYLSLTTIFLFTSHLGVQARGTSYLKYSSRQNRRSKLVVDEKSVQANFYGHLLFYTSRGVKSGQTIRRRKPSIYHSVHNIIAVIWSWQTVHLVFDFTLMRTYNRVMQVFTHRWIIRVNQVHILVCRVRGVR